MFLSLFFNILLFVCFYVQISKVKKIINLYFLWRQKLNFYFKMGNRISIDDSIFELKLQKKELERQYNKRDRDSKSERKKAKDAIISGKADLSK